eukprot:TRINITY_DN1778_c0_g1_i1.p1 TRINITY_DN1778_c0_g1~~TRINITY_DN1778_c0_g1_i1.p1  ORF type:complete len:353 (+),score=75.73 TRINITY_DN1778_c0_g1_i1:183-1241(+)
MKREQILNERYEKRLAQRESFKLRKRMKKRKTSSKRRDKASALSDLGARRKERHQASPPRELVASSTRTSRAKKDEDSEYEEDSPSEDSYEGSDGPEGSPVEDKKEEKPRNTTIPSLYELNSIRLTRDKLEKWVAEPFFKYVVPGFFVRIGLGLGIKGKRVYRVAEIESISKGDREYQFGNVRTKLVLNLAHGAKRKAFRMEFISNQDFSLSEFNKWVTTMKDEDQNIISRAEIEEKLQALKKPQKHVYKAEEIIKMVKKRAKKHINVASRKIELAAKLDAAENEDGSLTSDKKMQMAQELKDLKEKEQVRKPSSRKRLDVDKINQKNMQRNIEDLEIASREVRFAFIFFLG